MSKALTTAKDSAEDYQQYVYPSTMPPRVCLSKGNCMGIECNTFLYLSSPPIHIYDDALECETKQEKQLIPEEQGDKIGGIITGIIMTLVILMTHVAKDRLWLASNTYHLVLNLSSCDARQCETQRVIPVSEETLYEIVMA